MIKNIILFILLFLFILLILFIILYCKFSKLKKVNYLEGFSIDKNKLAEDIIKKQPIKKIIYNEEKIIEVFNKYDNSLILLEIKNNKVILKESKNINELIHRKRINYILSLIENVLKKFTIRNIIIIINLTDNIPNLPIGFLGGVYEKNKNCLSIPLNWWSYFGNEEKLFDYNDFNDKVQEYKNVSLNKNYNSKIIFRGTNNSDIRREIALLNNKYSKFIDVKLPKNKKNKNYINNNEIREKYDKFLILRGRGKWTGSLNQFALANGVLFIVEEVSKQPFELLLNDNDDYISIKNDLSNFEEKIKLSKNKKLMTKLRKNLKNKTQFFNSDVIIKYIYLCITNLYKY